LKLLVGINFIDLLPCEKMQVSAYAIAQSADYFVNVLALSLQRHAKSQDTSGLQG
jgi:hypothetical protein